MARRQTSLARPTQSFQSVNAEVVSASTKMLSVGSASSLTRATQRDHCCNCSAASYFSRHGLF
jgi:hypothetical protein